MAFRKNHQTIRIEIDLWLQERTTKSPYLRSTSSVCLFNDIHGKIAIKHSLLAYIQGTWEWVGSNMSCTNLRHHSIVAKAQLFCLLFALAPVIPHDCRRRSVCRRRFCCSQAKRNIHVTSALKRHTLIIMIRSHTQFQKMFFFSCVFVLRFWYYCDFYLSFDYAAWLVVCMP